MRIDDLNLIALLFPRRHLFFWRCLLIDSHDYFKCLNYFQILCINCLLHAVANRVLSLFIWKERIVDHIVLPQSAKVAVVALDSRYHIFHPERHRVDQPMDQIVFPNDLSGERRSFQSEQAFDQRIHCA